MVDLTRTIKVDQVTYQLIETARNLLENIMPTPVNQGTIAGLGAVLLIQQLGKFSAQISKSPQGQIYLALVKAIRETSKSTLGDEAI